MHTQGEWKAQGNYNGDVGIWSGVEPICFLPTYQRDSILPSVNAVTVRKDNANLLAAAPDMLAALKQAIPYTNGEIFRMCKVAIAKAEGK